MQIFALTLALHRAGQFSWLEWTEYLAAALKTETNLLPDSAQDEAYYQAWLAALCAIVTDKNITSARQIAEMKKRWVDPYTAWPACSSRGKYGAVSSDNFLILV